MNAVLQPQTTTGLASESGHWYWPDGRPCYEVRGKNGQMRPATLRDAKKLVLYPGVSGVMRCSAQPGLEIYKQNCLLMAAMTLPRIEGEDLDSFAKRVKQDAEMQSLKARERGTEIHTEIEEALLGRHVSEFAAPVLAWLDYNFPGKVWSPERSFGCPLGYGGKVDLHAPGIVIDFKSKDYGPDEVDKIRAYDEHLMQLVAYAYGLGEDLEKVVLMNVFISTRQPGLIVPVEWDDLQERARGWRMFQHLLSFWKAQKRVA